jgi:hypothetical protein
MFLNNGFTSSQRETIEFAIYNVRVGVLQAPHEAGNVSSILDPHRQLDQDIRGFDEVVLFALTESHIFITKSESSHDQLTFLGLFGVV